jgi:hypothetical protein
MMYRTGTVYFHCTFYYLFMYRALSFFRKYREMLDVNFEVDTLGEF